MKLRIVKKSSAKRDWERQSCFVLDNTEGILLAGQRFLYILEQCKPGENMIPTTLVVFHWIYKKFGQPDPEPTTVSF